MKYLILSSLLLFLFSCRSTQHSPDSFTGQQLHFGSGGGFTGMVKTFSLLEDGQLYVKEEMKPGKGEFSLVKKVKKKTCKKVFEQVDSLGLAEISFQHPGNIYSFIAIGQGENQHRITWGAESPQIDQEIQDFFESLQELSH